MWWSNGLSPGAASGSNRPRSRRAAIAMPTAEARPWPSGPVVISTPVVCRNSGWPGVLLPQVRSASMSASSRPKPREVQLDVEGEAGVPAGQHEPVAAEPVGVAGVVAHRPAGTACRPAGPGSSRCRGGRCRPSARRPRPAPGWCRRRAGRARSSRRGRSRGSARRCRSRARGYSLGSAVLERRLRGPGGAAPSPRRSLVTLRRSCIGLARTVRIYRRVLSDPATRDPRAAVQRLPSTGCRTADAERRSERARRDRALSEVATGERARLPSGIRDAAPTSRPTRPRGRVRQVLARVPDTVRAYLGLTKTADHRAAARRHRPGDVPGRARHPAGRR